MFKRFSMAASAVVLLIFIAGSCAGPQQAATFRPDSAFVFKVHSVNPVSGGVRQITGDYQLRFSKSTLFADLPYFGRAYSAPVNPNDGGIKLNTTEFNYHLREKKKGWELTMRPIAQRDIQLLVLSVSESGHGTLQVTSTNRQTISYSGIVSQSNTVNN